MKTVKCKTLAKKVSARKTGLTAAGKVYSVDSLRNKGTSRTSTKRELLDRAEARAAASGLPKVVSYR